MDEQKSDDFKPGDVVQVKGHVLIQLHIAKKVGDDVELVQEGDIVLIAASGAMAALPQLKETCALIHKDHISGVIRGYDWKTARRGLLS